MIKVIWITQHVKYYRKNFCPKRFLYAWNYQADKLNLIDYIQYAVELGETPHVFMHRTSKKLYFQANPMHA